MSDGETAVALQKFLSGYNCAQAILYAFAPGRGLEPDLALKVATGLGAGIARRGEVCGAVTGGVLALSLNYGRGEKQDRAATEETYRKTEEFMAAFERRHGSCNCRVLLQGCDLRTAAGQQRFKEADLLHRTCAECVGTVADILSRMLPRANEPLEQSLGG